jgi:hypothetical protein
MDRLGPAEVALSLIDLGRKDIGPWAAMVALMSASSPVARRR